MSATYRVHNLFYVNGGVRSQDISELDVASDDLRVAEWGDITAFTSNYGRAVAQAVNEDEGDAIRFPVTIEKIGQRSEFNRL